MELDLSMLGHFGEDIIMDGMMRRTKRPSRRSPSVTGLRPYMDVEETSRNATLATIDYRLAERRWRTSKRINLSGGGERKNGGVVARDDARARIH